MSRLQMTLKKCDVCGQDVVRNVMATDSLWEYGCPQCKCPYDRNGRGLLDRWPDLLGYIKQHLSANNIDKPQCPYQKDTVVIFCTSSGDPTTEQYGVVRDTWFKNNEWHVLVRNAVGEHYWRKPANVRTSYGAQPLPVTPTGLTEQRTCVACGGTGSVGNNHCSVCQATGKVRTAMELRAMPQPPPDISPAMARDPKDGKLITIWLPWGVTRMVKYVIRQHQDAVVQYTGLTYHCGPYCINGIVIRNPFRPYLHIFDSGSGTLLATGTKRDGPTRLIGKLQRHFQHKDAAVLKRELYQGKLACDHATLTTYQKFFDHSFERLP